MAQHLSGRSSTSQARKSSLFRTASLAAVIVGMLAGPAEAQLVRLRGGSATLPDAGGTRAAAGSARPTNMRAALGEQRANQARVADLRAYVVSARQAATTSVRASAVVTDGLSDRGLLPIAQIREAVRLSQTGLADDAARSETIVAGLRAATDPTGKATWEGAGIPVEAVAGGATTVSITQTQSRALLSWNRFDIGANTTVQFNQQQNGVAQPGWIAVNRVVDSVDPTTILGKLKADGSVYILNGRGVIFAGQPAFADRDIARSGEFQPGNLRSRGKPECPFVSAVRDVAESQPEVPPERSARFERRYSAVAEPESR